jgi:SAM-dependent methyltransferase
MATPLLLTAGGCRLDFGYSAEREWVPERGGRYGGSVADEPGGWEKWEWDETLFAGTAEYYERGRLPYALGLTDALVENLGLNGRGRLLDVGCGPGTVALRLASVFQAVVGVDSDAGMLAEAARSAAEKEVRNATWLLKRAEALPAGLGTFSVVTFGASFHWMDRLRVAAAVKTMLEPGGAVVQVDAPAYRIDDLLAETELGALSHPPPPDAAIEELRQRYLGPDRRAGRGIRNTSPSGEDEVFQAAGFLPAQVVVVPDQRVIDRSIDDIVANRFSSSGTARHVFGDRTGRASHSPARLATRRNRSHRRRRRPGDPPASACPHPTRRRVARTQPWGRFGHHDGASPSSGDAVQQGHHGASPLRVPERRSRHGEAGEEHLRSVNDVVMAMCAGAGALRTWLSQRDALPQTPLVAMIPVSVRDESGKGKLGNRASSMLAVLPTNVADPEQRLSVVHEATKVAKAQQAAIPQGLVDDISDFAPPALVARAARVVFATGLLYRLPPFNLTISNCPRAECAGVPRRGEAAGGVSRVGHH